MRPSALLLMMVAAAAAAASFKVDVQPLPVLSQPSPALTKALDAWRSGIARSASSCAQGAAPDDPTRKFTVKISKSFENDKIVVLVVRGVASCGGPHPELFDYGIAFDAGSGARVHLESAYALGRRKAGSFTLKAQAVEVAIAAYRRANRAVPACLDDEIIKDEVARAPYTLSVEPAGNVSLHMSVPYAIQGCFDSVTLTRAQVRPFRDAAVANRYSLP